ncbi:MAG TPA: urease subunit beta, partial [Enterobacter sp.]|nr:urease subunit beta [Enterobacter sp.]
MIPGEYQIQPGQIVINADRDTRTVIVENHGDRPIQVGSQDR